MGKNLRRSERHPILANPEFRGWLERFQAWQSPRLEFCAGKSGQNIDR
nr:MAG TPA: hypothetical protein [Caudoviricetes sp.]